MSGLPASPAQLAEIGYTAEGEFAGWVMPNGRPMPRWAELGATEAGLAAQQRRERGAAAIELAVLAGGRREELVRALGEMVAAVGAVE